MRKIRQQVIKTLTAIAVVTAVMFMTAFDNYPFLAPMMVMGCGLWLLLIMLANCDK